MGKKRFIAEVGGMATTIASRLGNTESGIWCSIRGWDSGITIDGRDSAGTDMFEIYVNGGSHDSSVKFRIGDVWRDNQTGEIHFEPAKH
jgi:hypothetical protein